MPDPIFPPHSNLDPTQIAGALAEAGCCELVYTEPGRPPRTLQARVTDLPGILQAAPVGSELSSPGHQARFTRGPDGWRTSERP